MTVNEKNKWNFHPKLPVKFYPLFDWPPSPMKCINFVWNYWLQKSDRTIFLILSFLIFYFIVPPMQEMVTLEIGWISMLAIRNYILIFIVAGGLHWWFFLYQGQGNKMLYSLTWRVSLSLVLFFLITLGILTGYLQQ